MTDQRAVQAVQAVNDSLLAVDELSIVERRRGGGDVTIVDRVSFAIGRGETLALVGESGCGKSVTALSLLRLLDPPLAIASGCIRLARAAGGEGAVDLLALPEGALRRVRGKRIAMVFQEPMTALNPVLTIGEQIGEALELHEGMSRKQARARSIELLDEVRMPAAARQVDAWPHLLSGGMRQRALIAMALACGPELLIADEPTTALDVTVQAQILSLLEDLAERRGMAMLLITHDLGVVAETAQRVAVMYSGRIVEEGPVAALFAAPSHPYTRALFAARPAPVGPAPVGTAEDTASAGSRAARGALRAIRGSVPLPEARPAGCPFHPRCDERLPPCDAVEPRLERIVVAGGATGHRVACHARETAP